MPVNFSLLVVSDTAGACLSLAKVSVVVERWSKSRLAVTRTTEWPGPMTVASMSCSDCETESSYPCSCCDRASPMEASIPSPPGADSTVPLESARVTLSGVRPSTLDDTRCTMAWTWPGVVCFPGVF